MSKEQTPIFTDGFKPPFRVGRRLKRAIVDSNGRELQTFNKGLDELAKMVCDMLNGTYCNAKVLEALERETKIILQNGYDIGVMQDKIITDEIAKSYYETEVKPKYKL